MLVSCKLSLRGYLGRVLVYASRNLIGYFSGRVRGVVGLVGVTRMAASVRD